MPRAHQLLYPQREPARLLSAATVLLLRDGADGLEVLMTRRSMQASFAAGAYVFPGGGIDAADADAHAHAARRADQDATALTQAIAAIRESFEELGLLLARHADGRWADAHDIAALDRQAPASEFSVQCARRGLTLAADQIHLLAHWISDRDLPRRFDVPFLIAHMPPGQTPVADEREQFAPVWVRPADAIQRHAEGNFLLIFPTLRTLERLQAQPNVAAVFASVRDKPWFTSCPRAGWLAGHESRHMEHEAPFGELALTCPDGQIVHRLDWQTEQPVALLKNVQRLTAPNPGVMTGPGTNSYLVGDPDSGYAVIDPGPADVPHLEALWRATGGNIRWIVCTHSHADHSPGARPLQALCERHGHTPPILGLASRPTARANSAFTPDREVEDGERLVLTGLNGITHTLRLLHTPGHAANHLCLVLEEDGLLFSGDHVLNGSTTVIDPPDGHMDDYLTSLDKLDAACVQDRIEFILPAHGHVLGNLWGEPHDARACIAHLKAHRLQREAKIAGVMRQHPDASMDDWVKLAYDDVPPRLWPVAMRSLLAHVERIRLRG